VGELAERGDFAFGEGRDNWWRLMMGEASGPVRSILREKGHMKSKGRGAGDLQKGIREVGGGGVH